MGQAGTKAGSGGLGPWQKGRSNPRSLKVRYLIVTTTTGVLVGLRCRCVLADWALIYEQNSSDNGKLETSDAMAGKNNPQLQLNERLKTTTTRTDSN